MGRNLTIKKRPTRFSGYNLPSSDTSRNGDPLSLISQSEGGRMLQRRDSPVGSFRWAAVLVGHRGTRYDSSSTLKTNKISKV